MGCLSDDEVVALTEGALGAAALDDPRRAALLAHLDTCDDCRALVADVARGAEPTPPPGDDGTAAMDRSIQRYELRGVVGAGAMGIVYRAFDPRLAREVALKLQRAAEPDAALSERLLAEAHALARLAHPNVVAIYDVGVHDGQLYLAMALGRQTLAGWLAAAPRPASEILRLVRQAGEGLAAAHATGILHRDIKPDNVLLGADGRAQITDFGLARSGAGAATLPADADLDRATVTATGVLVGTPAYMALEQLEGRVADERSDQFAYCVLLVEAMTGARPFPARSLGELRTALATEQLDAQAMRRLPRWLRAIAVRGLRADPAARWRDLRALLDAIDRGPPVTPVRLAIGGTIAAAALITTGVAAYSYARVSRAKDLAEARRDQLVVEQARQALAHDPTAAIAWLKQLAPGAANWHDAVPIAREAAARGVAAEVRRGHTGAISALAISSDGRRIASAGDDGAIRIWDDRGGSIALPGDGDPGDLAFAPDGPTLAACRGETLEIWDLTAQPVRRATLAAGDPLIGARFVPAGPARGDVVLSTTNGLVERWDWQRGARLPIGKATEDCDALAVSPDGATVAGGCEDAVVHLWPTVAAAASGARTLATRIINLHGLAFTGDAIAVAGLTGLEVVPLAGGAGQLLAGHEGSVRDVAARGDRLLSGGQDRTVRLWRAGDPAAGIVLAGHTSAVSAVAFGPDAARIVTGSEDGSLRIWRVPPPAGQILPGQDGAATWLAVSPDGRRLAVGGRDTRVRVWDLVAGGPPRVLAGHGGSVRWLAFAGDGRLVSTASDGSVWLWDAALHGRPLHGGPNASADLAIAPASDLTAWLDDATLYIRGLDDELRVDLAIHAGGNVGFAGDQLIYSDGQKLFACAPRRCAETRRVLLETASWIDWMAIAASPAANTIALSTHNGTVHLVDVTALPFGSVDGSHARTLRDRMPKAVLRFAPDGRHLAAATPDGRIGIWDIAADQLRLVGHGDGAIATLRWTPDGGALVSASFDHTVRVFDTATGAERVLRGHDGKAMADVLPDGQRVVSVSFDGTVRLWPLRVDDRPLATRAALDAWLAALTTATIDGDGRPTSP